MQLEEHKHIRFVWLPIFANLKYTWFRDMFTFLELGKSLLWILYLILKLVPCMFPKVNRDSYGTLSIETDDLANYSTGWFPSSQTVIIYSHYIVIICHYVYNCIYIWYVYVISRGYRNFPKQFSGTKAMAPYSASEAWTLLRVPWGNDVGPTGCSLQHVQHILWWTREVPWKTLKDLEHSSPF